MANKTNTSALKHSSPGLYFNEVDLTYAAKSLGITSLGLVGEALRGPAFQRIPISNWRQYTTTFGGTSTAKFKGSQYPKYELPYIAKTYLDQSEQLEVVRVLGLSGVNAGPAWVITANKHKVFTGFTYQEGTAAPAGAVWEGEGKNGETIDDIKDLPVIPYITENDPLYYRLVTGYEWHSTETTPTDFNSLRVYTTSTSAQDVETVFQVSDMKYIQESTPNPVVLDGNGYKETNVYPEVNIVDGNTVSENNIYLHYTGAFAGDEFYYNIYDTESGSTVYANGIVEVVSIRANETRIRVKTCTQVPSLVGQEYMLHVNYTGEDERVPMYAIDGTQESLWFSFNAMPYAPDAYNSAYFAVAGQYYQSEPSYGLYYTKIYRSNLLLAEEDTCGFNNMVVAVLRSRGEHKRNAFVRKPTEDDIANGICDDIYSFDGIEYYAKEVSLEPAKSLKLGSSCNPGYSAITGDFSVDAYNYGKFVIKVVTNEGEEKRYSVSLNAGEKDYIYNVIGGNAEEGDAEIYVEELYDVALKQLIEEGNINSINSEVVKYPGVNIVPQFEDVNDFVENVTLSKKDAGKRFLFDSELSKGARVRYTTNDGTNWVEYGGLNGCIYTVKSSANPETGKREYFYGAYATDVNTAYTQLDEEPAGVVWTSENEKSSVPTESTIADPEYIRVPINDLPEYEYYQNVVTGLVASTSRNKTEVISEFDYSKDVDSSNIFRNCVKVLADNLFYLNMNGLMTAVTLDFNNYKEPYRYSSTPWIVSEVKGSATEITLNKLFRFHTISDGNYSSSEVKVSIENIDPTTGLFDVVVRSFNDSDLNTNVLERYTNCNLVPGTPNYIALKIGSFDNSYASMSNYITVEVIENDITRQSIPAGFLGFPIRNYNGVGISNRFDENGLSTNPVKPYFKFNTTVDEDIKIKRQYFGVSDLVGIDTDVFTYKGVEAYNDLPDGLTPCFHLDARIFNGIPNPDGSIESEDGIVQTVNVDGVTGYTWETVNKNIITDEGIEPRIGDEETMSGTIYENKAYRKFTVCFYGGFDGWDYYRTSRSVGDEFTARNYRGSISSASGYGANFNVYTNNEGLDFGDNTKVITSDYYAYLGAIRQFANPKVNAINVLATPGIDYVNNPMLVNEVVEMVEEDRQDCIYVITTPDKPFGASDSIEDMYTPEEAVDNLEDSGLDTNYCTTFYPWERYFDADNSQYIFLPITRDVVSAIAYTDNIAQPWYAAAGWNRGIITGDSPKRKLKLAEQDTLYDGRINFVNTFAGESDKIWGDKNLQIEDTQLNRVSTRRLLLRIRTLLKNACIGLLFDPNDNSMAKTVESAVKAVLDDVKTKRGIIDYKISVDNSPEMRDKSSLGVTYYIKRANNLEFINFTSVLTPEGMQWD